MMIFGPIFKVKATFPTSGSALLREQGNPDSIRFMLRRFAGPRHDGHYVYAIAT
jgi:hypothetical protein